MVAEPGDGDPEDKAEGEAGPAGETEAGGQQGEDDSVVAEWEAMLESDDAAGGDDEQAAAPAGKAAGKSDDGDRVPALHDVELDAYAILGTASMPVSQLLRMGRGAVVELSTHIGDQIDIKVNNLIVARGEVVVVQDRIAVEITEVVAREKD